MDASEIVKELKYWAIVGYFEESNRVSRCGSLASQPLCHPSMVFLKLLLFLYICSGLGWCKV